MILLEWMLLVYRPYKLKITENKVPEIFRLMSKDMEDYAIIEFPQFFCIIDPCRIQLDSLFYQTVHRKNTTSTIITDKPKTALEIPLIRALVYLRLNSNIQKFIANSTIDYERDDGIRVSQDTPDTLMKSSMDDPKVISSSIKTLKGYNFKYLILYDGNYPDAAALKKTKDYLNRHLRLFKHYPDDKLTVYLIK